jgi:hypothetical protein
MLLTMLLACTFQLAENVSPLETLHLPHNLPCMKICNSVSLSIPVQSYTPLAAWIRVNVLTFLDTF